MPIALSYLVTVRMHDLSSEYSDTFSFDVMCLGLDKADKIEKIMRKIPGVYETEVYHVYKGRVGKAK